MNEQSNTANPKDTSDKTTCIIWLFGAAALILGSFLLKSVEGRQVALRGINWTLPETCATYRFFGVSCPGCGLTRSFVAMSEGRLSDAWQLNPAGIFIYLFVWAQIPLAICCWYSSVTRSRTNKLSWLLKLNQLIFFALLAALLVQWLVRSLH